MVVESVSFLYWQIVLLLQQSWCNVCSFYDKTSKILFYSSSFFFFLFMAAPVAYGNSQAKGWTGAAAEPYVTATATLNWSHIWDLYLSLEQWGSLTPRARSGIEPASPQTLCQVLNCWATWELLEFISPPPHSYLKLIGL